MLTTGKNRPCPCGSGKKYKLCCLPPSAKRIVPIFRADRPLPFEIVLDYDPLDDLSNSVLTLIAAGDLDAADAVCVRLLADYPDQIDGLSRSAHVAEARGDHRRASNLYRQAARFAATHEDFDEELIAHYTEEADRLEAMAAPPAGR